MKRKIIAFLCTILMMFSFSGCSFTADDTLEISTLTTKLMDDGTTMVMITYTDETIEPTIFYIPKGDEGEKGETGTGIREIKETIDPISKDVTITIYFTDTSMEPIEYTLKNGVSIANVTTKKDEETGITYMTIHYTDGTTSEPLEVPKGDKGEEGRGIIYYEKIDYDDGSIRLVFIYSDGEEFFVDIPAPQKGEEGRGIAGIVGSEEIEGVYRLIITFTDGSEEQIIDFTRPTEPNTWHTISSGKGPLPSLGRNGDYCYDTVSNAIYNKQDDSWVLLVDFDDVESTYTVTFNLNADDAYFPDGHGYSSSYELKRGQTFYSFTKETNKNMPVPSRPGYNFTGWYTAPDPTEINGKFTDLTPVFSDMILFATWSEK